MALAGLAVVAAVASIGKAGVEKVQIQSKSSVAEGSVADPMMELCPETTEA